LLWEEKSGKRAAARRRETDAHLQKTLRQWKKMLFRGNELKKSFEMKDLDFYNAENEPIFECQRAQIGPRKW